MKMIRKIYHRIKSSYLKDFDLIIAYNHMKKIIEKFWILLEMPKKEKKTKFKNEVKPTETVVTKSPSRQLKE